MVATRLRSALAATSQDARDQAKRRILYGGPAVSSRYATAFTDLAEVGEPLDWSDVISSWPDDVDLDAMPEPPPSPAPAPAAPPTEDPTSGFPPGTAWASPPRSLGETPPSDPVPSPSGVPMHEVPPPALRPSGPEYRPLPPPAWVLPEEPDDALPWPSPDPDEPEQSLTAEGAFGGSPPDNGKRFGLGAFDPGNRGVKALALVAVVVIVIAAFLAWRSRPRVDTVAPPSFENTGATVEPSAAPSASELVVAVGGKVRNPGLVRLPPGSRVADALTAAGGAEPGVDVAMLNLARKVVDGELIMVGVTPPPGVAPPAAGSAPAAAGGLVNLNTATLADLDTLPGVGPVLAQRILDARDAQGGFRAVSDLRKVDGIGDARYEELKDLVTV